MTLTTAIILNVVLDALVTFAIVRLLSWAIVADRRDRAEARASRRQAPPGLHPRRPHLTGEGRWRPAPRKRQLA